MATTAASDVEHANPHARRRARMGRFLFIAMGITLAMHIPVVLGVVELARRLGVATPWAVGVAWGGLGVGLFVGRIRAGMPDRRRGRAIVWLVDLPYFIHWCAAILTLIPAIALTLVLPLVQLARGEPMHVPVGAYLDTYIAGLAVSAYGVLVRRKWFRVVEREVRVTDLPPAFDGFRVAHLSDLHVGTHAPRARALQWSRAANERTPDLALVTGDLVTSGNAFDDDVADVIGALRAKLGVFSSMGNHDYFGEGEALAGKLRQRGVTVLRNEGVVLEKDGARLWLAAIDDVWTRRDDLGRAMAGRPEGVATVLMAHDPKSFDAAADAGANLVLSGHTHGGQVAVPLLARTLNLARLGYKYTLGFYRRGRATLYVHPGLGTTGPPVRLGVAPEVTILVLRAG